ncbi:MAG TPA: 50S ribosomal protein L28, partial [Clostridiales bacterium]|nr:50S ribosomal protein L28 [Clostridiales bacterium]
KRVWNANIQKVRAIVDGSPKRINVCTRCLRSNKIERAL